MAKKKLQKKAKQWYKVISPEMFGSLSIGETLASDPNKLMGRVIETTLGELTNNFSKHNIKLRFKIDKVAGDSAYTKFIGHEMTLGYIQSLVRRRSSRIDGNINVTTNDGYLIRVKPCCFTLRRARSSQVKLIRNMAEDIVEEKASNLDLNEYILEIVKGKFSLEIYNKARYIYPLRRVDIRKTEIQKEPAKGFDHGA